MSDIAKYDYIEGIYVSITNNTIHSENYYSPSLKTTLYDCINNHITFKYDNITYEYIIDKCNMIVYNLNVDELPIYTNNWKGYITLNPYQEHLTDLYILVKKLNHNKHNNKKIMWEIICEEYDTKFLLLPQYDYLIPLYNALKIKYNKLLDKCKEYYRKKKIMPPNEFMKLITSNKLYHTLYWNNDIDMKNFLKTQQ